VVFFARVARWYGRTNYVFCVATDEHAAEGRGPHREAILTRMVGNRVLLNRSKSDDSAVRRTSVGKQGTYLISSFHCEVDENCPPLCAITQ
jgi:hypothetical protein